VGYKLANTRQIPGKSIKFFHGGQSVNCGGGKESLEGRQRLKHNSSLKLPTSGEYGKSLYVM